MKSRSTFPLRPLLRIAAFAVVTQALAAGCRGCGCTTCEQEMYDTQYAKEREREIEHFEYEVPVADSWKELVALLSEQGFTLPPTPVEGRTVETDWKSGSYGDRERVLVRVDRISAKHYKIELKRQVEITLADGGRSLRADRDKEIEWELLKRAEPARSANIEDKAEKAGERGGAVGRGCDRGCETCLACAETCDRCNKAARKVTP